MPGYMVLPSVRFKDVKAAVAFYAQTLGFEFVRGGDDEVHNSVLFGQCRAKTARIEVADRWVALCKKHGVHFLDPKQAVPMKMIGHVTSSYWSATLGRSIALALVQGGFERMGETLHVPMPGRSIVAKVSAVQFYDPEGSRLNG